MANRCPVVVVSRFKPAALARDGGAGVLVVSDRSSGDVHCERDGVVF
jgi:hypothetical protein